MGVRVSVHRFHNTAHPMTFCCLLPLETTSATSTLALCLLLFSSVFFDAVTSPRKSTCLQSCTRRFSIWRKCVSWFSMRL